MSAGRVSINLFALVRRAVCDTVLTLSCPISRLQREAGMSSGHRRVQHGVLLVEGISPPDRICAGLRQQEAG